MFNPLIERLAYQVHEEWIYDVTELVQYKQMDQDVYIPEEIAAKVLKLVNTPFELLKYKEYMHRIVEETQANVAILTIPEYAEYLPEALLESSTSEKAILRSVPSNNAKSLTEAAQMYSHFRMKLWFAHMLKNFKEGTDVRLEISDYERWMRQATSAYDNSLPTKHSQLLLDTEKQGDRNQVYRLLNAVKPFLKA